MGFNNGQDVDLDKLIKLLEENHDLLQDIVINDESSSTSALPKMLLDLVNQINDKDEAPNELPENSNEGPTGTLLVNYHFVLMYIL